MIDKGNIVFSSPPIDSNKKRIVLFFYAIGFFITSLILIRYFTYYLQNSSNEIEAVYVLIISFVPICAIWLLILLPTSRMLSPKIMIYEKGIARFTNLWILEREGEFIPYSNMKSFIVGSSRKDCRVDLVNPSTEWILWSVYKPEHINPIVDALSKQNIIEAE